MKRDVAPTSCFSEPGLPLVTCQSAGDYCQNGAVRQDVSEGEE